VCTSALPSTPLEHIDPRAEETGPKGVKCLQFGVLSPQEICALAEFEAIYPAYYEIDGENKRSNKPKGVLDRRLVSRTSSSPG
jgi:hypothetical protein